ncbi:MAG: acyl carrier protein [Muricomes sp.]
MKEMLQEIWKEVLELEKLPETNESFFELGGNSFSAAQVIATLEERIGRTLEVVDFYDNETIDEFIKLLA